MWYTYKEEVVWLSIGERIRALRTECNLTQKELGNLCGMADSAIRRYESGRGNPTEKTLQRIASALGCSVGYLVDGRKRLGDKIKPWASDRAVFVRTKMDSGLFNWIQISAERDGLSWDEEHDMKLHDLYVQEMDEMTADEVVELPPEPKNVHDWTDAEMHAELQRQLDAEKEEMDESSTSFSGNSGTAIA